MKDLIFSIAVALSIPAFAGVSDIPEDTKRVCIKVYDGKQKKDVEKCKRIKVHKKYNGHAIPGNTH